MMIMGYTGQVLTLTIMFPVIVYSRYKYLQDCCISVCHSKSEK